MTMVPPSPAVGTAGGVEPPAADADPRGGRTRPAILRNLLVVVVVVAVTTAALTAVLGRTSSRLCSNSRADIDRAELRHHQLTGGYTDLAGLRYAGLLTTRVYQDVRLNGFPGSSSAYEVVATDAC